MLKCILNIFPKLLSLTQDNLVSFGHLLKIVSKPFGNDAEMALYPFYVFRIHGVSDFRRIVRFREGIAQARRGRRGCV